MFRYFLLLILLSSLSAAAQIPKPLSISKAMEEVPVAMRPIKFSNHDFDIPTEGGHLQGIQYFESNGKKYVVVSGSSSTVAYYAVVHLSQEGHKVVHYKVVGNQPFKHAGGIQMYEHYLAIGVEDNLLKDRSKVMIFDLSEPGLTDALPLITIEREGKFKASTAGAVGFTKHDEQYILAVAGWDTKQIDFYRSNMKPLQDTACRFVYVSSWNTIKADRSDWMNRWWHAYQNINLLVDSNENLFMMGMHVTKDGNFVDQYQLSFDREDDFEPLLVKQQMYQFYCVHGATFRNGGGIYVKSPEELIVMSIAKKLKTKKTLINWFGPLPFPSKK